MYELTYNTNHFRSLMRTCNTGVIITNSTGYIIDMNQKAFELLELREEDCIGSHFFDILDFSLNPKDSISLSESMNAYPLLVRTKKYKKFKYVFCIDLVQNSTNSTSFDTIITFYPSQSDTTPQSNFMASYTFDSIIKSSYHMKQVERISKVAARTSSNVLIYGESGTGKELIAHAIHNESNRRKGPFVALNCGAIPAGLIESELFGYEGGTFTGARSTGQMGKIEMASGGTLFLDEIGNMPLHMQVILLRFLETREVLRLGGKNPKKVDIRVIAATNVDLKKAITENTFREDLFYRLNVFTINVPPLRERKEDIKILVNHFISQINERENLNVTGVDKTVLELFMEYNWPGNIRELENIVEWCVNMADDKIIRLKDLPNDFIQSFLSKKMEKSDPILENRILNTTLSNVNGNVNKASALLGVSRRTLYRKFEKYDIDPSNFRNQSS